MDVSLLVPLAEPNDPTRDEHWSWLRSRWQQLLPATWAIREGRAAAEPWVKAHAVSGAAEQALGGVWIVIDADVLLAPQVLIEAASLVAGGETPWVHPHRTINRLSKGATAAVVAHPPDTVELPLSKQPSNLEKPSMKVGIGGAGGGCLVIDSAAYLDVGGFDPRFTGWSKEDINLGRALRTLVGPPVELGTDLWHLWHPPQTRLVGKRERPRRIDAEGKALNLRYRHAFRDRQAMAALVAEHQEEVPA